MAQLVLQKKNLLSRQIRKKVTGGNLRKINLNHAVAKSGNQSWLAQVGNFFAGIGNFISGTLSALKIGAGIVSTAWGWLVGTIESVKSFNWNASDQELEKLMDSRNTGLAAVWGAAFGNTFGWLAGIGVGYGISFLCPVIGGAALANSVASSAGLEAIDEIRGSISGALFSTVQAVTNNIATSAYINYRKLFKQIPQTLLESIYGKDTAYFIKNVWGQNNVDMSFNTKMDEAIEGIKNDKLRAFVDAFLEESWDSFTEAGFIIAAELDNAYAQAKRAQEVSKGKRRHVRLIPDRALKGQDIILAADQFDLQQNVQTTLTQYRIMENKDIGQIVGQPVEDFLTAKPKMRSLQIIFKSKAKPPWVEGNKKIRLKTVTYTIPDAKVGLDWDKIKRAAKKYTWGKFRCTANLDNGRQMAVYGSSAKEAETQLRSLLTLSTGKILSLSVTEEKEKKNIELNKRATLVYPAYACLLIRKPTGDVNSKNLLTGKYHEDRRRIELWHDKEPIDSPTLK